MFKDMTEEEIVEAFKSEDYPRVIDLKPVAKVLEMTWREHRMPAAKVWDSRFTTEVSKNYKISLCTNAMNRLSDIQQTLPKNIIDNISYPNLELVLLDYNSSDGLVEWIKNNMIEHINSGLLSFYRTEDPQHYDMSHSRNITFLIATGEVVNSVDGDAYTNEGFAEFINKLANEQPQLAMFAKSKQLLRGRLGFYKDEFINLLGGYDEGLTGYGHDDQDLMNRAWELGFTMMPFRGPFSGCTADHIKHKTGNYKEVFWLTEGRNRFLSYVNIILGKWKANEGAEWGKCSLTKMNSDGKMVPFEYEWGNKGANK